MTDYSVLMSVYVKEKPEFLLKSIESVMAQTILPNDFVIICDGPINDELNNVLDLAKKKYNCINIYRYEVNHGLSYALAYGITKTKNEIVMRMDSDDICLKERAEVQLPLMEKYDLVGSNIVEFEGEEDNIIGYRKVPEKYDDIYKFAKKRNPFNHPSVIYRKSVILEVGNYDPEVRQTQDYNLWVRVLLKTKRVYNVQQILVKMRSGKEMRSRRKGKMYLKYLKKTFRIMLDNKMITRCQYNRNIFLYRMSTLIPTKIKEKIYRNYLRKNKE